LICIGKLFGCFQELFNPGLHPGPGEGRVEHHDFEIYRHMSLLREGDLEFVGMSSVGHFIEEVSGVHIFARHKIAPMIIANSADIRIVQKVLRHNDIRITLRYAHVSDKTKRKNMNNV
jgi:hypothetical protein